MMASTEEGTHRCADGTQLYTKTWKPPSGDPVAKVVFVHGFSDHCNTYLELFPTLACRQILVYAFDQRGWGRSVKKLSARGRTGSTSQVLDDIDSVVKSQLPSDLPLFLMGHSMGGGEVLVSFFPVMARLTCVVCSTVGNVKGPGVGDPQIIR